MRHGNFSCLAAIFAVGSLVAQDMPTSTLTGRVTDRNGAPIVGATVSIDTGRGVRTIKTNERGEWRMPLLPTGSYTLNVSADGYIGQKADADINPGQTSVVNFALAEACETE